MTISLNHFNFYIFSAFSLLKQFFSSYQICSSWGLDRSTGLNFRKKAIFYNKIFYVTIVKYIIQ